MSTFASSWKWTTHSLETTDRDVDIQPLLYILSATLPFIPLQIFYRMLHVKAKPTESTEIQKNIISKVIVSFKGNYV